MLLRDIWRGRVWCAWSVTVVEDSADRIALYTAPGTRRIVPRTVEGHTTRVFLDEWTYAETTWVRTKMLTLGLPGASRTYQLFWDEHDGRFLFWKGDLHPPLRRTVRGFDKSDYLLDVLIEHDLSWSWKDAEQFEEEVGKGFLSPAEAAAVRAEGYEIIRRVETRDWPFCDGWDRWAPSGEWSLPDLPSDWEAI